MSNKIAIVSDTGCGLYKENIGNDTFLIPLYIHFKDKSYKDMEEIDSRTVYEKMKVEIPKTSISSPGEIKETLETIRDMGYDNVLIITISSALSGIYSAFELAAKDIENLNIKIIDSKNISMGTGFLVKHAERMLEENPEITLNQLYEKINGAVKNSTVYFTLETLEYLIAGGRIGKVAGGIGSLLKIKPIITCDENGVYNSIKNVRSTERAFSEMISLLREHLKGKKNYIMGLVYRDDVTLLDRMKNELSDYLSDAKECLEIDLVSPALGVHTGESLIGVGACYLD